jgi:hypothetical protein
MPDQRLPAAAPTNRQDPAPSTTDHGGAPTESEQPTADQPPSDGPMSVQDRTQQRSELQARDPPRTGGEVRLADVIQVLSLVVAPTTLVTALLYYFGWSSTGAESRYFGMEQSLLGLSTTDYLLRSVPPMFWPLSLLVLTVILALLLHLALMRTFPRPTTLVQRWVPIGLGLLGLLSLREGLGLLFQWRGVTAPLKIPTAVAQYGFLRPSVFLATGIALISYAGYLWDRLPASAGQRRPWAESSPWAAKGLVVFPILLILLFIFWAVSDYAADYGSAHAQAVEYTLKRRPSVTVYSAKRLYIDDSADDNSDSGVREDPLPQSDGAYRYRYQGLRLLGRSNGRYFLLPENWSASHPVTIVLLDSDTIRVELRRGEER